MASYLECVRGQIVAKTPVIIVHESGESNWDYAVDVAQIVGAIGAVVAIPPVRKRPTSSLRPPL